jgi:predicted nucleotidyltransferase
MIRTYLGSRTAMALLDVFLSYPSEDFYAAEAGKAARVSKSSAVTWLAKLLAAGLLKGNPRGRMKLYILNGEHPVVKQLKTLRTMDWLYEKLKRAKVSGEVYLFGSAARGEDDEKSDFDLLLISKKREEAATLKFDPRIRTVVFTQLEWEQMAKKDPAFFERVEKDKIKVL